MRPVGCGTFQREMPVEITRCWKHFIEEASEDQLRAALIKPGDSVIIKMKRLFRRRYKIFSGNGKKGGTAVQKYLARPLWHIAAGCGFFCV